MRRLSWILLILMMMVGGAVGAVCFTLYDQYWNQLPPIDGLLEYKPPVATRVYADDGELAGEFFFEKRYLTAIEDIPPVVRYAFVAAEDSDFYSHRGIDIRSIARAFVANLLAGNVVQGGSTITQQVVKALLLTPERSYKRKLREIMLSLRLERELTKNQILFLYLNEIYLGDGNYGVGAAARSYFDKKVGELTLPEAALLAGLPQAPSRYSPTRNPQGALSRQRYVLKRMRDEGFITDKEYAAALDAGVAVLPRRHRTPKSASYYVEFVRQYLEEHFGKQAPYHQGFSVYTGIDAAMQKAAESAVRKGVRAVDMRLRYRGAASHLEGDDIQARIALDQKRADLVDLDDGELYEAVVTSVEPRKIEATLGNRTASLNVSALVWSKKIKTHRFHIGDVVILAAHVDGDKTSFTLTQIPELEGALFAMDPSTGHVKAMVGGYDFQRSQFNRAVQAKRQPGSAIKPFVYAAALDAGYTPASILLDAPIQYIDHDKIWRPQNYSRRFYGPTTLRHALEKSRNVVTVRVVQDLGADKVRDYVKKFGFTTPIGANLSIGLGTSEVIPEEITSAYAVFANAGVWTEPVTITRIEDANGWVMLNKIPRTRKVISPQTAYLMTSMLQGVVERGTGRAVRPLNRPVAGKTGTTDEQRDAWFIGFTPHLVTGVWVGYDDDRTLGSSGTGGRVAAPIFLDFMSHALAGTPVSDFEVPADISCVHIDTKTGLRARPADKNGFIECFHSGSEPVDFAPKWQVDPDSGTETLSIDGGPTPLSHDTIERYRSGAIFQ